MTDFLRFAFMNVVKIVRYDFIDVVMFIDYLSIHASIVYIISCRYMRDQRTNRFGCFQKQANIRGQNI